VWFPLIVFSLRNTQSHPISVISDTYAQMVTARPGAVVSLPAMTIRLVVGRAAVGPEIAQVWGGGRIATLTLTGNLTSNGAFVPNVYSATNGGTSAGTINGCIGLAQAVLNQ
jgi:hypothetical protein